MARARIICIGSAWHPADWVGPAVFAALHGRTGPDVDLVDGGLLGLNLLGLMEGVERVVFADTLADGPPEATVLADPGDWCLGEAGTVDHGGSDIGGFDHGGGLGYLLAAARAVVSPLPRVWLVGAPAAAEASVVGPLAQACLALAAGDGHAP